MFSTIPTVRGFIIAALLWGGGLVRAAPDPTAGATVIVPNARVTLRGPRALSTSPEGLLYIADTGNHRIVAVDTVGTLIYEAGGLGEGNGQFRWPRDVAAEYGVAVWVLDYGNRRLQRFSRSLEWQRTIDLESFAELGETRVEEIALTPSGDLFLLDADNSQMLRLDPNGQLLAASSGQFEFLGRGRSLVFAGPAQICWVDISAGELHCADFSLNPAATPIIAASYPLLSVVSGGQMLFVVTAQALLTLEIEGRVDTVFACTAAPLTEFSADDRLVFANSSQLYLLQSHAGQLLRLPRITP